MRQAGEYWFPDKDTHFKSNPYQLEKLLAALNYVKERGTFLDVGAHCGTWSLNASKKGFKHIIAVEPLPEHIECYKQTMKGRDYHLIQCIAGNDEIVKIIRNEENSGGTTFELGDSIGDGFEKVVPLDTIIHDKIDLVKIDVQGMERCVLEGMVNILLRDRPVIIVEQKKHKDALSYLEQIGFKKIAKLNGDYIFV